MRFSLLGLIVLASSACGGDGGARPDGGSRLDGGVDASPTRDAGMDASSGDGAMPDVGQPDAGERPRYDETVWPTTGVLSSPFGSRIKGSTGTYDFHRGIDIAAESGTPVVAFADGTLRGVYPEGSSAFPTGGNVVMLAHEAEVPIPLGGTEHLSYWSVYLHLASFSDEVVALAPGDPVPRGMLLGGVGMTGATYEHLHFEVRVGTWCSIEYQLANPGSSCVTGLDPHVNPLRMLDYDDAGTLSVEVLADAPPRVRVTSSREELDFDSVAVARGERVARLAFDAREAIAPGADRDDPTYGPLTIEPAPFNASSTEYALIVTFDDLDGWDEIVAADIWGDSVRLSAGASP